jgi:hypothetical protein
MSYYEPVLSPRPLSAIFSEIRHVVGRGAKPHSTDPHGLGRGWTHISLHGTNEVDGVGRCGHYDGQWETNYGKLRPEIIDSLAGRVFLPIWGLELFSAPDGSLRLIATGAGCIGSATVCIVTPEKVEEVA